MVLKNMGISHYIGITSLTEERKRPFIFAVIFFIVFFCALILGSEIQKMLKSLMKMNKETFVVPQKAIIKEGDKYLILKRSPTASTYPNCWDFPGGRLEAGEDPIEGLKREVKEETGLKIEVNNPIFVFRESLNDHENVFIVYSCGKVSGEIKLSHEHTEFKWATKEEILRLDIENYLRAFLEKQD